MKSLEISVDHFDSDSDFDSDGQDLILNGCLDDNDFETHEQPNLSFVVDEASSESHDSQSEMTIPEDDTPSHSGIARRYGPRTIRTRDETAHCRTIRTAVTDDTDQTVG